MSDAWISDPISDEETAAWIEYWDNLRPKREYEKLSVFEIQKAFAADAFRWAWIASQGRKPGKVNVLTVVKAEPT